MKQCKFFSHMEMVGVVWVEFSHLIAAHVLEALLQRECGGTLDS